jgi:hypothetical protein
MKKIISMFALVSLFAFALPAVLIADQPQDSNCHAVNFTCDGEPAGVVVICDDVTEEMWAEILC